MNIYKIIDDTILITVNDWIDSGLTYDQFYNDKKRGYLSVFRRGLHGSTLIDVKSIKRPDRLRRIEGMYGKVEVKGKTAIFEVSIDTLARAFFIDYRKPDGTQLHKKQIEEYTNRASILKALKIGLARQTAARATSGKKIRKGKFWNLAVEWYNEQLEQFPCKAIKNERILQRIYKEYISDGFESIIHKSIGNDAARKVSVSMEALLLSLWRTNDKPFANRVHELYEEFVSGSRELFDKTTGEIFRPEDFRYKGRAMEISRTTVWNYLKNVVNTTAVFADRNGNFDYANSLRPKHHRRLGRYTLSKISMDDVALSRQSVRGWVYKYISIDVVSGYYFRPAYVVGKPTIETIYETFRNMFCELMDLGLPMPGELEVEHHLMQDIDWLDKVFPFVRFCMSPTEKRAEHNIHSLKYGTAKDNGHTRGRWYAKSEAFKSVRNKVSGDYPEPTYQPQTIIADDLQDIEDHNNEMHPLQKTYPGMTRRDVFLNNINPELKPINKWYLYRFLGNKTETSIRNNDFCSLNNEKFELSDYGSLNRLKPNNMRVTAYWLPEKDSLVHEAYLYQGEEYIGEVKNRTEWDYNENKIEQTNADNEAMLHQEKRVAKFDKFVKERRKTLPKVGQLNRKKSKELESIAPEIVENEQPKNYEEDEFSDESWAEKAVRSL